MDKRKSFTISDKLQLVRQILEAVEDHNEIQLTLTVFQQSNNRNCIGKICDKTNLYKMKNCKDNTKWVWYHNGSDRQSPLNGNILITIFK